MKRLTISRLMTIVFCGVVFTLAFATESLAQSGRSGNVKISIEPVHVFGSSAVVPQAGASLAKNNDGVLGTISTSGLTPGTVVTRWWAIFNHPEFCASIMCGAPDLNNPLVNGSLQYGGGVIVGANGRADFGGYLAVGDNAGFYLNPVFPNMPNPAPGIVDPKTAQIHFVLRNHGPASADPAVLALQLTTFPGGCSMANPCANVQAAPFLQ